MAMISPSAPLRRWRSTSPSYVMSFLTHVYDVNLLERVGLDEELATILWTIGWGKFYGEPCLGSRLLTLEFLMTFEIVGKNRKSFVMFCLFRKSFGCDFSCFSELLDFSKSCLPESSARRNFNKVEFSGAIFGKSARLRFSDINNASLCFCIGGCHSCSFPWWNCILLLLLSLNVCLLW
jgi:hypothetical protein